MKRLFLVLVSAGVLLKCSAPDPEQVTGELADILKYRQEKDQYFAESADSPLPERLKSNFACLSYFPVDTSYRFHARCLFYVGDLRTARLE